MNPYGSRPDHLNPDAPASPSNYRESIPAVRTSQEERGRLVIRIIVAVVICLFSLFDMVVTDSGFEVALGAVVIIVAVTYALGRQRSTIGLVAMSGLTVLISLYYLNWLAAAIWALLLIGVWYARPQTS